jgi:hypothetical protein
MVGNMIIVSVRPVIRQTRANMLREGEMVLFRSVVGTTSKVELIDDGRMVTFHVDIVERDEKDNPVAYQRTQTVAREEMVSVVEIVVQN